MNDGAYLFTETIEGIGIIGFNVMSYIYFTMFSFVTFFVTCE